MNNININRSIPVSIHQPLEHVATSGSRIDSEAMEKLRKDIAQSSSEKVQLSPEPAGTPQQKQDAVNFYNDNHQMIEGNLAALGGISINKNFSFLSPGQGIQANQGDDLGIPGTQAGKPVDGMTILQAVLNPQPSKDTAHANDYSAAEEGLNNVIDDVMGVVSGIADEKLAAVAAAVLPNVKNVIGNALNIASEVNNGGTPTAIASNAMKALSAIMEAISGVVTATMGTEVSAKISAILGTISKALNGASEAVSQGKDPFKTAGKELAIATEQAGKMAGDGEVSQQAAAVLPHVNGIMQNSLNMASQVTQGNGDVTTLTQSLGGVVTGMSDLVSTSTDKEVSSLVSSALKPMAIVMKMDPSVISALDVQGELNKSRKLSLEQEAKLKQIEGDASVLQQQKAKEEAVTRMAGNITGAIASGAASVGGAAKSVKANAGASKAITAHEAKLSALQSRQTALRAELKADANLPRGTPRMASEVRASKTQEIKQLDADIQKIQAEHKVVLNKTEASSKKGDVIAAFGQGANVVSTTSAEVSATDARVEQMKAERAQKVLAQGQDNARRTTDEIDKLKDSMRDIMRQASDSINSLYQSIKI